MSKFYWFLLHALLACTSPTNHNPISSFNAFQITYRGHDFDVVQVDPVKVDLQFYLANEHDEKYRSFKKLKTDIEQKGKRLHFAMNGGMYLKDGSPQGLYIEKGQVIQAIDTIQNAYGNFYLQPNGVFFLHDKMAQVMTTTQYLTQAPVPDFATQSGPMLVIDNTIHPVFVEDSKNLHIRNGVGIGPKGEVFFAISKKKLNLYDFAMFFKEKLNCKNALYLDGFVSKAYIPDLNRMELGGAFGVMIGISK